MAANLKQDQRDKFGTESYRVYKIVPFLVKMYNSYMNGVDCIDEAISLYDREGRQTKWTWPYIQTSIKMAEAMAYKIYCIYCKQNQLPSMDHYMYKQSIGVGLCCFQRPARQSNSPTSDICVAIENIRDYHFKKRHQGNRKKCRWRFCRNNTHYSCEGCRNVNLVECDDIFDN